MLEIQHLTKVYESNNLKALDNLDLTVRDGEFVALIGLSGSGKSTLLRCINRLIEPSSGSIILDGVDITAASPEELRQIRRSIGMIFQQFNLVKRSTVINNVLAGRLGYTNPAWSLMNHFARPDVEQAIRNLDRVGIADKAYVRADTLSGGQQQRGAIARALVQRAKIILADEPVASLDPVSARKVMEILRELNRQDGLTVIVTLHQVDYALRYCDRVVALKAGKVVYDGPPSGLGHEALVAIYGPEIEEVFWEGDKS